MTRPTPPMRRRPDWPERLAALIEARRAAPFEWGSQDCFLFAADAVQALTGEDIAAPWRGRYASEAEAEPLLAEAGGLYALMHRAQLGRGSGLVVPALAQRGDTCLVDMGNDLALGVVLGEMAAAPGLDGLAFAPLAAVRRAWAT